MLYNYLMFICFVVILMLNIVCKRNRYMKYINLFVCKITLIIKLLIFFIIIILLLGILSIKEKIVFYNLDSSKIDCEFKIVLITDLHSCYYGKNMSTLIDDIKSQSPDVVLLGGDIFNDKKYNNNNAETFLKQISSMYKCYFVFGNHDTMAGSLHNVNEIKKELNSYGITVLNGNYDTMEIKGQAINICGIDDPKISHSFDKQLMNVSNVSENGNYTILLTHRPELIDKYNKYNFDLILAGHAHGGQVRIPKILNGLYAPHQGFFPKYAGGKYDFDKTCLIVSRGLARESVPAPRIFNNPEVVVINIIPK
ncbi:MAG: metallophosphoesterase [Clostridium sp.]